MSEQRRHLGEAEGSPMGQPFLLRQTRESAGLHIAALAAALKVPVKKLEALEAGRYAELPDMTFARALASSACRHLKVDPAPILAEIPQAITPTLGDSQHAINTPFKPAVGAAPANPVGWLSRPAVLGAIALMLGALVLIFLPAKVTEPDAVFPDPSAQVVMSDAPLPASVTNPVFVQPATPDVAPAPSEEGPLPGQPAIPPNAVVAPAVRPSDAATSQVLTPPAAQPAAAVPEPPSRLLSIRATGDSWVEVVNGSGVVVVKRLLKTGDVIDFSSAPPYAVVLGRADAVQVTVRGQPLDVTPHVRNSVARFEVK